jgi:hypothetical protein
MINSIHKIGKISHETNKLALGAPACLFVSVPLHKKDHAQLEFFPNSYFD